MSEENMKRVVEALERCAVALETIAADVAPRGAAPHKKMEPITHKAGEGAKPSSEARPSEPLESGPRPGSVVHAPAPSPVWSDEAAKLEAEFASQEAAKRVLGAELYQAVWSVEHDLTIADPVPIKALGELARRVLGGEAPFRAACDAVGVKKGEKPTGAQLRRLVLEHLVPAQAPEQAVDTWV